MRIRHMKIERFKSIREATLDNMGDLVIIAGRNDSGKSNLLDAVWALFTWFEAGSREIPYPELASRLDELWWDYDTNLPVRIAGILQLDSGESKLIDSETNVTYMRIQLELDFQDKQLRCSADLLTGDPPTTIEDAESSPGSAPVSGVWLAQFTSMLRDRFASIPATRDRTAPYTVMRAPIVEDSLVAWWRQAAGKTSRRDQTYWNQYRRNLQKLVPHWDPLQIIGNEPFLHEGEAPEHIRTIGGGSQSLLKLGHEVLNAHSFVTIEEPENHLHPGLLKRFALWLRSSQKQAFVVTHSPFLLDASKLEEIWYAERLNRESSFRRVDTLSQVREVINSIGVRPSDFLLHTAVLLVEGPADVAFYSELLKRRGAAFGDVSVFPMGGEGKTHYAVETWLEEYAFHDKPIYLALDRDAEKEAQKAIRSNRTDQDHVYVAPGELEDFYDSTVLKEALVELWGLPDEDSISKGLEGKGRKKFLQQQLSGRKGWRQKLAADMAPTVNVDSLDDGLLTFLDRIVAECRTSFS